MRKYYESRVMVSSFNLILQWQLNDVTLTTYYTQLALKCRRKLCFNTSIMMNEYICSIPPESAEKINRHQEIRCQKQIDLIIVTMNLLKNLPVQANISLLYTFGGFYMYFETSWTDIQNAFEAASTTTGLLYKLKKQREQSDIYQN